ncbi:hypothetical protein DRJ25_00800 [Candidatus Woesearchaeota archaeon]|nr:MAG: hypothetical protein DRJ25_00800 [Candidatus Woesearchaeota archaeon]
MVEKYFVISFDFDGVLALGYDVKVKYAKEWFGVDISPESSKKAGFEALMRSLGKQVSYRDLMDPINEEHIFEYKVPDGAIEVLGRLFEKNCRFVVVTSRNQHDFPYAQEFIREKFTGLIKYIHNTNDQPKADIIERLRPMAHVDDDVHKLEELRNLPVKRVYFRQVENKSVDGADGLFEVASFSELEHLIDGFLSGLHH